MAVDDKILFPFIVLVPSLYRACLVPVASILVSSIVKTPLGLLSTAPLPALQVIVQFFINKLALPLLTITLVAVPDIVPFLIVIVPLFVITLLAVVVLIVLLFKFKITFFPSAITLLSAISFSIFIVFCSPVVGTCSNAFASDVYPVLSITATVFDEYHLANTSIFPSGT